MTTLRLSGPCAQIAARRLGKTPPVCTQPNRTSISKRSRQANATWAILVARWPQVFPKNRASMHPLSVGILEDIVQLAPDLSKRRIAAALYAYTHSDHYLRALARGMPRMHLDGTLVAPPNTEERSSAQGLLRQRKARAKASLSIPVVGDVMATASTSMAAKPCGPAIFVKPG